MANAQGPEGRTVVAVPGSKGSHNEGMDLDEVAAALCFHPRLESSIFLLLLRASLGKSVGARLVGDCYINYESILGETVMEGQCLDAGRRERSSAPQTGPCPLCWLPSGAGGWYCAVLA